MLLIAGCSIGAIFGLYPQLLGSHFLAAVTGFTIVFNIEGVAAITSFGLVSVIAVAMLVIPGYSRSACTAQDCQPGVLAGSPPCTVCS